jgi:lipopolysaccharide export system permease protein
MRLIDRYIIRQFLFNFVILSVVLLMKIVLIDLLFSIDEFVGAGDARVKAYGGSKLLWTLYVICDFYGPMLLYIYVYLSGLLVVGAMGFTVVSLARSRELVTLIASGVSLQRVAAPILMVGCLLNGLTLVNQELFIPHLKEKLTRQRKALKEEGADTFAIYFAHEKNKTVLLSAAKFVPEDGKLEGVSILVRNDKGQHRKRISADVARWDEKTNRWLLTNGKVFVRQRTEAKTVNGVDYVFHPPSQKLDYFESELSPRLLMTRRAEIYSSLLGMAELGDMLNSSASNKSKLLRVMHSRFSLIVMNVLILVMTIPIFLTREPSNPMLQALRAALVAIGAWITGVSLLVMSSDTIAALFQRTGLGPDWGIVVLAGFVIYGFIVLNQKVLIPRFNSKFPAGPTRPMFQVLFAILGAVALWIVGLLLQFVGAAVNPVVLAWLPVVIYLPISTWLIHRIKT